MRHQINLQLCALLSVVSLAACGGDAIKLDSSPAVSVSSDKSSGIGPLEVQFFSSVVNGNGLLEYAWDFGDGETSNSANPAHLFESSENRYSVQLTVTDEDGDAGVALLEVLVGEDGQPTVSAEATPTQGIAPLTVNFNCMAAGGNGDLDLQWKFGEGSTDNFPDTTFTYTTEGVYVASCAVEDENGDIARDTVTIAVGTNVDPGVPSALANATPTTGTAPLDVEFFGSSIGGDGAVTLSWDFGDGATSADANDSHTYTNPGVYSAVLTAVDEDDDSDSAIVTITVLDPDIGVNIAPTAVANITNGACAMTGQTTVELDSTGTVDPNGNPVFLDWQFVSVPSGSNVFFNNSAITNPTFRPDRNGEYVVRLVANDGLSFGASDLLTVVADLPSVVTVQSGNNQTGTVDTEAATPIVANVANSCGATAANTTVNWAGGNMFPNVPTSRTDIDGNASNFVRFGPLADVGRITARVSSLEELVTTFDFSATAGAAELLVMDQASAVVVSETSSPITFRVADRFGNAVTAPDVSFNLEIDPFTLNSSALFNDCTTGSKTLTGITTSNGVATVNLCNTIAEDAFVEISQISNSDINPAGRILLFEDDMEREDRSWLNLSRDGNDWERGTPTEPVGLSIPSGTNVRGTRLSSALIDSLADDHTTLQRNFDLSYPVGLVLGAEISFEHYVDVQGSCAQAALNANSEEGSQIFPIGGYPSSCAQQGFEGPFADFQNVRFNLDAFAGDRNLGLNWTIRHFTSSTDPLRGAGWYIDDVRITALVQIPRLTFSPAAASTVEVSAELPGKIDGCSPALARGVVVDQFGNAVGTDGVALSFSSDNAGMTFANAQQGADFTGAGTTAATVISVDGEVLLALDTSAISTPFSANVTGLVTGLPAGANATDVLVYEDPSVEICGDGVDNDCDTFSDCDDIADCEDSAACHGENCIDPFVLGTDEFSETFSTCFHTPSLFNGSGAQTNPNHEFVGDCFRDRIVGEDMIMAFTTTIENQRHDICVDWSDIPGQSEVLMLDVCASSRGFGNFFGQCYTSNTNQQCRSFFNLQPGTYFFTWRGEEPGQCGDISIESIVPENCSDNFDNDADGFTDCEDQECIDANRCERNLAGSNETCDGTDNGQSAEVANGGPAGDGSIDEFTCRCFGDEGCDDMTPFTNMSQPLICNLAFQTCVPDCNDVDWCASVGRTCDAPTGQCL